jgi:uncharacterized protein YkwD
MPSATLAVCLLAVACAGDVTEQEPPPGGPDAADPGPTPDADPGAPDADPAAGTLSPEEQMLFEIINAERAAQGVTAVALRPDLVCAVARHSMDVGATQTCSHTGSDGSSPGDRVSDCGGAGWTGEIIACGQGTPRDAVDAWLASSAGHREIMLDPGNRWAGVAMYQNFWTAIFDQ